jgi:hypothetical protein
METLVIPKPVFAEIVASVLETWDDLETGVTLFGTSLKDDVSVGNAGRPGYGYVVLAIAGPGKRAVHEPAHYSGDDDHANEIYDALRSAMPGIRWIGELHVHPSGMTWLSNGDHRTVRHILTGDDHTLHPDEFIAGVMQRKNGTVDIYPFHFTREWLEGKAMGIQIVDSNVPMVHQARLKGIRDDRPSIRAQSERSRTARQETSRHHWLRQWWQRACRYGRQIRDRKIHPC